MKKYEGRILIIDDDEHVVLTSRMILKQYFEVVEALDSPKTLESKLRQQEFDIVLLDMNFKAGMTSGNEGLFWLGRIQAIAPQTQVVLQTAYTDIELAVKSIKEGAVDFLPKPWDKEKLVSTMLNAYTLATSRRENRELKSRQRELQRHFNQQDVEFVAQAAAMRKVMEVADQVAITDATALILGENGTGKEVLARYIHSRSARAEEPFISVDLGSIPTPLFESEMFGHEKGAFTDAKETRIGKFELANRGTLFLDEIGNLAPELQAKLLSVIQTKTVSKVGSNKPVRLDIRVLCATNVPLSDQVRKGLFRQDLYYRINTVEITLPPLRERKEDIAPLVGHFHAEFTKRYKKPVTLSPGIVDHLTAYPWPGNIRELQHAMERAIILCRTSDLTRDDFQLAPVDPVQSPNDNLNLVEMEKEYIQKAVHKWNGNLTRVAEELGIGRTTLYRKLEEYGLRVQEL